MPDTWISEHVETEFSSPNAILKLPFPTNLAKLFSNIFAKITSVARRDVRPAL